MLHKIPRGGLAASAVAVAYALNALELVPFVGVELQLSTWYQVCCAIPSGLLGRMLSILSSEGQGRGFVGSRPVAPAPLFSLIIFELESGYTSQRRDQRGETAWELNLIAS
jgi:hypothetical protein